MTAWNIQPSEFWQMTHEEWWWVADMHKSIKQDYYAGSLTLDDCDDLYRMLDQ